MKTLVESILNRLFPEEANPHVKFLLEPKEYPCPQSQIDEWVKALRSGKFDQAKGYLYEDLGGNTGYCCLGVKASLCGASNDTLKSKELIYIDEVGLEGNVDRLLDILEGEGKLSLALAAVNDRKNSNFDDVATVIEYHMKGRDE